MSNCADKVEPRKDSHKKIKVIYVVDVELPSKHPDAPNTKGLPNLPRVLHLEILSCFSCTPVPCVEVGEIEDQERFCALFALSQTCRALYHVYYPLFWKTVEARAWRRYEHPKPDDDWSYDAALDLRLYAKLLSSASYLAELVQVFNVVLTDFSSEFAYKWLARCLPRLPNLQTFQLLVFPTYARNPYVIDSVCAKHFQEAFSEMKPLSRVHTLTLPNGVVNLIDMKRTFPALRHLAIHRWGIPSLFDIHPNADSIPQSVEMLTLAFRDVLFVDWVISHLTKHFPDLRITPRLELESDSSMPVRDVSKALLRLLEGWKRVHTIRITDRIQGKAVFGHPEGDEIIENVKAAIQVNLSREENQDVVAGKIKIWEWRSSTLLQEITVLRPVKE